jgi:hypothetical protein
MDFFKNNLLIAFFFGFQNIAVPYQGYFLFNYSLLISTFKPLVFFESEKSAIEVGGGEKPAAIWEDTYYTFIIIKMAAFTYKNMFYFMRD